MLRRRITVVLAELMAMLSLTSAFGVEAGRESPEFREVYDVIRAHLAGANDAELNRAAVEGLVAALAPKVSLLSRPGATNGASAVLVSKPALFDGAIAYVRVEEVAEGLAPALRKACMELAASNEIKGLVLDLRYARGSDYAAAVAAVDLFLKKERPLLNWGQGVVQSTAKTDSLPMVVAALVNHQTSGAPEALAAMVREAGAGLVLGTPTAGAALKSQEFRLNNGDRLCIATAPVQLGDGSPLSGGLKPDILVEVNPEDERTYFGDAYKVIGRGGSSWAASAGASGLTNGPRRVRFNEAELVRERRESLNQEGETTPAHKTEPEKPLVQDPVLARALDLLKGLAVVRQARS
jgi:hypothetical protein